MTINNGQIYALLTRANGAAVIDQIAAQRLPGPLTYALHKTLPRLREAFDALEATRLALLKEHAEVDAAGELRVEDGKYVFPPGGEVAFRAAWAEVTEGETDVAVHRVAESVIERCDGVPYALLSAIDFIFEG